MLATFIASLALAAPPAPNAEQVAAAIAVLVEHTHSLGEVAAGDLVDLMEQTGVEASVPLDVRPLRRRAACFRGKSEVVWLLTAVRDAQKLRYREYGEYAPSLAALKNDSLDKRVERARKYFELTITAESFKGFRVVATGVGDLEGEEWSITGTEPETRLKTVCDEALEPTAPASDEALARALATLSRNPRVNGQPLARVVEAIVGRSTDGATLDEARLSMLVARVKTAGGDLRPVMQPVLNRRAEARCRGLQGAAQQHLHDLVTRIEGAISNHVNEVEHYVIERREQRGMVTFTAKGTGPMKGDVLTVSANEIVTYNFEYCANKKAPPLGK